MSFVRNPNIDEPRETYQDEGKWEEMLESTTVDSLKRIDRIFFQTKSDFLKCTQSAVPQILHRIIRQKHADWPQKA